MERSYSSLYEANQILAGRYRVVRVLGTGGMGVVVAARHVELDTLVAIKLLRPEVLDNPDVVARFAREARAAVKITSEHVARVTDVGTLSTGAPYMVMEHLDGQDLAALVETRGPLPIQTAVDYVLQACEAIAEAHSLGIVHRDLKPGNLFLSRRADGSEIVKVLDFGISKMGDGTGKGAGLTSTKAVLGSPTHMSPEQLSSSRNVDVRTDVWAIGVILHEILSGILPFSADTLPELFMTILQQPPAPLRSVRAEVPLALEALVLRCLEKDRERRFANVGELALALSEFAPERSRVSVERVLRLVPVSSGLTPPPAAQQASGLATVAVPGAAPQGTQGTWGQTASKAKVQGSSKALVIGAAVAFVTAGGFGLRALLAPAQPAAEAAALPVAAAIPAATTAPAAAETAPAPQVAAVGDAIVIAPAAASASAAPKSTDAIPARTLPPRNDRARRTPSGLGSASAAAAAPAAPPAGAAPKPPEPPKAKPSDGEWELDRR